MSSNKVELSVIIASLDAAASLPRCLRAWQAQVNAPGIELIVAVADTDTVALVEASFPGVRLLQAPSSALIPDLWAAGLKEAQGEWLALSTAHCLPAQTWAETALQILRGSDYAAVGGAIEALPPLGKRDWAVYFLRYNQYGWPFKAHLAADLPGDNVLYRRAALAPYLAKLESGFWENEVHPQMRASGAKLFSTPDLIMFHQASPPALAFFGQRFRHGRRFGAHRVARTGTLGRLKYLAQSPLIPLAFTYRITRRTLTKGRYLGQFLLSLPLLLFFILGWWSGEVYGYLVGAESAIKAASQEVSRLQPE